ncbi:class I SAM-dependent methyltransferase [Pseudodesulfovibrio sp.]|uniref:class I SAM-dependent methyltransferase n=1 Tax=unclassified Pseudodesulfovibrio TaxID=2661612 RepID=UPI003B009D66
MAVKDYDLEQPMDRLLSLAANKFGEVEFQPVTVGGQTLEVLQIKQMQRYIDKLMDQTRSGKTVTLPLWAKIWQSGLVLASFVSRFPLAEGGKVLQLGGGAALGGLLLARRGFAVTVVDKDPDALLFARINALKNGLDSVRCVRTDFRDELGETFDCAVAGEMLFDESVFNDLAGFLDSHLATTLEVEVFLALDLKRAARNFFTSAGEKFAIMRSETPYTDNTTGEKKTVSLFRFKRRGA